MIVRRNTTRIPYRRYQQHVWLLSRILTVILPIGQLVFLSVVVAASAAASASATTAPSYYELLGVDNSATDKELKKAFRRQSLKYHPDKKGGSEEKFKDINKAYDTLSDPQKRQLYDLYGEAGVDSGATGPNSQSFGFGTGGGNYPDGTGGGPAGFQSFFMGQDGSTSFQQQSFRFGGGSGGAGGGASNIDLSEILKQVFGGQGMDLGSMGGNQGQQQTSPNRTRPRQSSYTRKIRCTLEDLATGKTKKLKVAFGQQEKIYTIPIKKGWKAGTKITYKGNQVLPTMIFVIEEIPHKFLRRDGDDLKYVCWISDSQRQGGIQVKVPLPTGEVWKHRFERANESSSSSAPSTILSDGQVHVVKNMGMPIKGGPERGNLIITFRVRPASVEESSKAE